MPRGPRPRAAPVRRYQRLSPPLERHPDGAISRWDTRPFLSCRSTVAAVTQSERSRPAQTRPSPLPLLAPRGQFSTGLDNAEAGLSRCWNRTTGATTQAGVVTTALLDEQSSVPDTGQGADRRQGDCELHRSPDGESGCADASSARAAFEVARVAGRSRRRRGG